MCVLFSHKTEQTCLFFFFSLLGSELVRRQLPVFPLAVVSRSCISVVQSPLVYNAFTDKVLLLGACTPRAWPWTTWRMWSNFSFFESNFLCSNKVRHKNHKTAPRFVVLFVGAQVSKHKVSMKFVPCVLKQQQQQCCASRGERIYVICQFTPAAVVLLSPSGETIGSHLTSGCNPQEHTSGSSLHQFRSIHSVTLRSHKNISIFPALSVRNFPNFMWTVKQHPLQFCVCGHD